MTRPPRRAHRPRRAATGALLLAAAACGDTSPTAPAAKPAPPIATRVVAAVSARALANDILLQQALSLHFGGAGGAGGAAASTRLARPSAPSAAATVATYGGLTCTLDEASMYFTCPPVALQGMTVGAGYALFDGAGVRQYGYDDNTTARADIDYTVAGSFVSPDGGHDIERARAISVTGLAGDEETRRFDGEGTGLSAGVFADGSARAYALADTMTVSGVAYGVPFLANPWPREGTVTSRSQLEIFSSAGLRLSTTNRRLVITFTGARLVPMTVDGTTYTLDLATGDVTQP